MEANQLQTGDVGFVRVRLMTHAKTLGISHTDEWVCQPTAADGTDLNRAAVVWAHTDSIVTASQARAAVMGKKA